MRLTSTLMLTRIVPLLLAVAVLALFGISNGARAQEPTGSITIIKHDGVEGTPLAGAGFTLFTGMACETFAVAELITDDNGLAVFDDLPFDTYCVVETTVPAGYQPVIGSDSAIPITIDAGMPDREVELVNVLADEEVPVDAGSIEVLKSLQLSGEPQELPIAGVGFQLFDAACAVAVSAEVFTDDDGSAFFEDLALDTYCVVETTPLDGFDPMDPEVLVLTAAEPDWLLEVVNEPAELGIVVAKLYCPDVSASLAVLELFEEPDVDIEACEFGVAEFTLSGDALAGPFEFEIDEIDVVELNSGTYQISETAPSQVGPVTFVLGDEPLLVLAINPVGAPPPPVPTTPPATPTAAPRLPDTAVGRSVDGSGLIPILIATIGVAGTTLLLRGRYPR